MKHRAVSAYARLPLRWIVAVFVVELLALVMTAAFACSPLPTCGDPGTVPGYECATPTPTLRWTYDEGQQNGLIGYRVWWRVPPQAWSVDRSWVVPCWIYVDEETGISSRVFCRGRDLDEPVQRSVGLELTDVEFAVAAIDRWNTNSARSGIVGACMPPIWRGGPYY